MLIPGLSVFKKQVYVLMFFATYVVLTQYVNWLKNIHAKPLFYNR